jgi:hypothetical protein
MWHSWKRREECTRFWWERLKERVRSEDQGVDGRMGSEWMLGRVAGNATTGSRLVELSLLMKFRFPYKAGRLLTS